MGTEIVQYVDEKHDGKMTKNKQTSSIGCNLLHKTKTFETTSSQTKTHRFIFLISSSAQEVQMCELKSQTRAAHRC